MYRACHLRLLACGVLWYTPGLSRVLHVSYFPPVEDGHTLISSLDRLLVLLHQCPTSS